MSMISTAWRGIKDFTIKWKENICYLNCPNAWPPIPMMNLRQSRTTFEFYQRSEQEMHWEDFSPRTELSHRHPGHSSSINTEKTQLVNQSRLNEFAHDLDLPLTKLQYLILVFNNGIFLKKKWTFSFIGKVNQELLMILNWELISFFIYNKKQLLEEFQLSQNTKMWEALSCDAAEMMCTNSLKIIQRTTLRKSWRILFIFIYVLKNSSSAFTPEFLSS